MPATLDSILGPEGAIARRLGARYEFRPQQLEMASAVGDASFVDVSVDRTGLSDMSAGLRYLIEYPYGCLEQTLSRFIPMTQVKDLAATLHIQGLEGPRLEGFIKETSADELIVATAIHDHAARLRSYEILGRIRERST